MAVSARAAKFRIVTAALHPLGHPGYRLATGTPPILVNNCHPGHLNHRLCSVWGGMERGAPIVLEVPAASGTAKHGPIALFVRQESHPLAWREIWIRRFARCSGVRRAPPVRSTA